MSGVVLGVNIIQLQKSRNIGHGPKICKRYCFYYHGQHQYLHCRRLAHCLKLETMLNLERNLYKVRNNKISDSEDDDKWIIT